jgi:hypothetical protein
MNSSHLPRLIDEFGRLLGTWTMVGSHPAFDAPANGTSSFEWLEEGALLIWRFQWRDPGPPSAVSVIGWDDAASYCCMVYSDVRGVSRVYETRFEHGLWKMWRTSPGFSQRMTGTFSDDGNTIEVHGELSRDDATWQQDLDVIYMRQR